MKDKEYQKLCRDIIRVLIGLIALILIIGLFYQLGYEKGYKEGYERGYEKGYKEGYGMGTSGLLQGIPTGYWGIITEGVLGGEEVIRSIYENPELLEESK